MVNAKNKIICLVSGYASVVLTNNKFSIILIHCSVLDKNHYSTFT